jgi:hypothetical protein
LIPRAGPCFFWIYSSFHFLCYGLIIIDKALLLMGWSIGVMFLPVNAYLNHKTEIIDVVGQCMLIGGGPSVAIGSLSGRVARREGNLHRFSLRTLRHVSFFDIRICR